MSEYYEDVTVKNALGLLACWMDGKNITCGDIQNLMKRMQPADVVEVVRCKDCKYSYDSVDSLAIRWLCSHGVCAGCIVPGDFYCKCGERKESKE